MENCLSRPPLPARLELIPGRLKPDGSLHNEAYWEIRDHGRVRISTRCGEDDRAGAEKQLTVYLASKHEKAPKTKNKSAAETACADVISHYAKAKARKPVARPKELAARLDRLLTYWGSMTLDDVDEETCADYADLIGSDSAARRHLEDFRAAIKGYAKAGLCREYVVVSLPDKSDRRVDFFERSQVAAMLWHCWRFRRHQYGRPTADRPLRHLVPFILTAIYTGTRSRRIWRASYVQEEGRPWIDLEGGVYHRLAKGETAPKNKRAASVRIPGRLLAHMRRWSKTKTYLVEYQGEAGDPKKALTGVMEKVFGKDHPYVRHTFRHTCATWLLWSGEKPEDIAAYMSMTKQMLFDVYGHDNPNADREVGKAFTSGRAGRRAK